ncbi:MAG: hypothetical protein N2205_00145 [Candidatus Caldatribacterium sp.]|uniref:TolB family protein n=1 Tax=Candidatus Caldatribacterium sp. TaxID=2282143 RepID=UPI002990EA38|nr:hypothetical protein [Candidatus Caldatribacterium sp.]MCX7729612.1 hypothetical protein [Candidatus Caldatribacterium sp.]MDW8081382.1 hypothetical protein [Candidatus Calescibacterium sp.]
MKWSVAFSLLALCGISTFLPWNAWAEEIFFFDMTERQFFAPLADFLQNTLSCRTYRMSWDSGRKAELVTAFAGWKAYLLLGYDRENLLCFEVWDLEKPQKILGMVRKAEDISSFLEGLRHQLPRILSREKEWKILFVRFEEGKSYIVLTNLGGGKEAVLPPPVAGQIEAIHITPEGQFLLASVASGNMVGIFQMDLFSRVWRRLSPPGFSDSFPVFFPFRRTILFLSERGGKKGIYEMNLDGSKQRLLLERANPIQGIAASPHGSVFAFSEFRNARWVLTLWDVLREKEQTLSFSGNVFYPAFGKRGELFFIGEEGGMYDVYSLSLANGSITRLTFDGLPKAYLAVSPDGQRLVFSVEADAGNWDIVLLELVGRKQERFTSSWARETSPIFSPVPLY